MRLWPMLATLLHRAQSTATYNRILAPLATPTLHEAKKSRFYALAAPCASRAAAREFAESNGDPKASHNCWAAVTAADGASFSDDGEPSGSAGRPILSAIEGANIVDCVVLVTRFFGGTKLGTGGMARAYGAAARLAIASSALEACESTVSLTVRVSLADAGKIYSVLARTATATKSGEAYEGSLCQISVSVAERERAQFETAVVDATGGSASIS